MNQNVKLGIAAGALLIGGVLIFKALFSGGPDGGPVGKQPFANVTTGEIVYLSQRDGDIDRIPAKDKTGKNTLFPVEQDDSGAWVVISRYRGTIDAEIQAGSFSHEDLKIDPA